MVKISIFLQYDIKDDADYIGSYITDVFNYIKKFDGKLHARATQKGIVLTGEISILETGLLTVWLGSLSDE